MLKALSDKYAVERIAMQRWQASQMNKRVFFDGKGRDPVGLALSRQVFCRRFRQRELARRILLLLLPTRMQYSE